MSICHIYIARKKVSLTILFFKQLKSQRIEAKIIIIINHDEKWGHGSFCKLISTGILLIVTFATLKDKNNTLMMNRKNKGKPPN